MFAISIKCIVSIETLPTKKFIGLLLDDSDIVGLICFPSMYWTPPDGAFEGRKQANKGEAKWRAQIPLSEKMGAGRGEVSSEEV